MIENLLHVKIVLLKDQWEAVRKKVADDHPRIIGEITFLGSADLARKMQYLLVRFDTNVFDLEREEQSLKGVFGDHVSMLLGDSYSPPHFMVTVILENSIENYGGYLRAVARKIREEFCWTPSTR